MKTDLEIAQQAHLLPIAEIAEKLSIPATELEPYGRYIAKLPLSRIDAERASRSRLVLVTAISPTPGGEGKTTVSIGLTDGLNRIGKRAVAALREPSLGPVFGLKEAPPEEGIPKCCRWRTSTCIYRRFFGGWRRRTICFLP